MNSWIFKFDAANQYRQRHNEPMIWITNPEPLLQCSIPFPQLLGVAFGWEPPSTADARQDWHVVGFGLRSQTTAPADYLNEEQTLDRFILFLRVPRPALVVPPGMSVYIKTQYKPEAAYNTTDTLQLHLAYDVAENKP